MSNNIITNDMIVDKYYETIDKLVINSKKKVIKNINYEMVNLNYDIGKVINELIERYHLEASQNEIIKTYSKKLTEKFGKEYGISNLKAMKKFYLTYKTTGHTLCDHLSWSHNRLIMNINDEVKQEKFKL